MTESASQPGAPEGGTPALRPSHRPDYALTDFCTAFPKLEQAQQERFRSTVTKLLAGRVLTPGSALRPDLDWQFVDRFGDLIVSYLRLAGWSLDIDRSLGYARAVHEGGEQRVRFSKFESLVLLILRLMYHEQKLLLRDDDRCRLTTGDVRERLIHAGLSASEVSRRKLALALRALDRHYLVDLGRGFEGEDDETMIVQPVIEAVLTPDRIDEYVALVERYCTGGASAPADEDDADETSDDNPIEADAAE